MTASKIIELVGSEVTWEILNADGTWHVWASHHGETDDEFFTITGSGWDLDNVTRSVANRVLEWQKAHGWAAPEQDKGE